MADAIRVGRRSIPISNRNKVLFPDDGITKGDLIEYYVAIAPRMLPHVRNRPLTLERYPDGLAGERIMQKNASKYFPDWIPRAELPKKDGVVMHVVANDAATLAYLANQASITQHAVLSTTAHPFQPDVMIIDLDPSIDDFSAVRDTALLFRSLLEELGLVPFVKTTGSKGLHVVVPIRPTFTFEVVHEVAARVAKRAVEQQPDLLTTEFMKKNRGDRIFIDVHRNAYAQTAVAPYSVRPRPGVPVAAPVTWEEVADQSLKPDGFSMRAALERPDHWRTFRSSTRALGKAIKALGVQP
ncbi:MAG: non-homologous end-joining DNA ligase [Actinomycetota bacterium]